jgi:lysophospholipase L1-like esterase
MAGRDGIGWGTPAINLYLDHQMGWGAHIQNYALVGSSLHEGWVKSIPTLYRDMIDKTKPTVPTTVLMNGGGNDVITARNDCFAFNDGCRRQVDSAMDIAKQLLLRMSQDGVQHVIYLGFYYVKGMQPVADYGTMRLQEICGSAPLDCHVADVRDLNITTGWDGVHPTQAGYEALARRLWDVKNTYNIPI